MKKLLLFIGIIALFAFSVNAQDSKTVARNGTNVVFVLDAGDTILNANTLDKEIALGTKLSVQLYQVQVRLDSISGTPAHTTVLAGSMDGTTFADIDTVSWAGSTSDTTFYFTDISTGIAWRFVRLRVTGSSSSKSQMTVLSGRFFDEVR